jgi:hypothetical protein
MLLLIIFKDLYLELVFSKIKSMTFSIIFLKSIIKDKLFIDLDGKILLNKRHFDFSENVKYIMVIITIEILSF